MNGVSERERFGLVYEVHCLMFLQAWFSTDMRETPAGKNWVEARFL